MRPTRAPHEAAAVKARTPAAIFGRRPDPTARPAFTFS
jgi:hypothetical protein